MLGLQSLQNKQPQVTEGAEANFKEVDSRSMVVLSMCLNWTVLWMTACLDLGLHIIPFSDIRAVFGDHQYQFCGMARVVPKWCTLPVLIPSWPTDKLYVDTKVHLWMNSVLKFRPLRSVVVMIWFYDLQLLFLMWGCHQRGYESSTGSLSRSCSTSLDLSFGYLPILHMHITLLLLSRWKRGRSGDWFKSATHGSNVKPSKAWRCDAGNGLIISPGEAYTILALFPKNQEIVVFYSWKDTSAQSNVGNPAGLPFVCNMTARESW